LGNGKKVTLFPTPQQIINADLSSLKTTQMRKTTLITFATDPENDDVEGAHEASTQAAMWILGDTSIRKQLREWQKARRAEQIALDQLKGAMIAADLHGEPIARIAAEVGITRPTVYSWLGKA
jgi:DNA-directed RNA polymerase specialized sigma24 family protein